jgi:hypothetical protein
VAEADLYVAIVDEKVLVKIGTRYDVGDALPSDFHPAAHGKDYRVWEKGSLRTSNEYVMIFLETIIRLCNDGFFSSISRFSASTSDSFPIS